MSAASIRRAAAVHPISDLQIEYSLISRGLISGHWRKGGSGAPDFRSLSPRFQDGNVERNLTLVEALRKVADAKGVTLI